MLTARQLEVLELVAKGLTNRDIGRVLNISPGTAKVHVSRVIEALGVSNRAEAAASLSDIKPGQSGQQPVPGFGARPTIVVLPFDDFSSGSTRPFFTEGLVEDLTTQLALWRWFPVVARNTAMAIAGRNKTIAEICAELGCRYAVEGSARWQGDRVRVQVQLIDGSSEEHLYAQRYDRTATDVLALQDDIVHDIVGTLEPVLLRVEGMRALQMPTAVLDAWSHFQRGMVHLARQEPQYPTAALAELDAAIALDEQFAPAHAGRSLALHAQVLQLVGDTHFEKVSAEDTRQVWRNVARVAREGIEAAQHALVLDPLDPAAQVGLGLGLAFAGEREPAMAALERALELNPSSTAASHYYAVMLLWQGDLDRARVFAERAIHLSPLDANLHHFEGSLACIHLAARRLDEALAHIRTSLRVEPEYAMSMQPLLPACLAHLGRLDEARDAIAAVRERWPHWNLKIQRVTIPGDLVDYIADGYEKAGWRPPE